MIEATQSAPVRVSIGKVWNYVKDIRRWAELMPGLQNCEIIDDDNSHWVLKVGGGSYHAEREDDGTTEMTLTVRVGGSGAMAPMWEAMGAPLLPKFARAFAEQLAAGIEKCERSDGVAVTKPACIHVRPC